MFLSSDNSGCMVDVTMMLSSQRIFQLHRKIPAPAQLIFSSQRLFQSHRKIPGLRPTNFFLSAAFPTSQENPRSQTNKIFPLSSFSSLTGKSLVLDQQNFSSQRLFQPHRKIPEPSATYFFLSATFPASQENPRSLYNKLLSSPDLHSSSFSSLHP